VLNNRPAATIAGPWQGHGTHAQGACNGIDHERKAKMIAAIILSQWNQLLNDSITQ